MAISLSSILTLLCHALPAEQIQYDKIWNQALTAFESSDYSLAAAEFENWISAEATEHRHSVTAHLNAATAYEMAKQRGRAIYHLMQATRWESNPLLSLSYTQKVGTLEQGAGLPDGLGQSVGLGIYHLLSDNTAAWTASISLWLLALFVAIRAGHGFGLIDTLAVSLCLALCTIAALGVGLRRISSPLAVVISDPDTAIYDSSTPGDGEKPLGVVPQGTVVSLQSDDPQKPLLNAPIRGYIARDAIALF